MQYKPSPGNALGKDGNALGMDEAAAEADQKELEMLSNALGKVGDALGMDEACKPSPGVLNLFKSQLGQKLQHKTQIFLYPLFFNFGRKNP
jgi:hypothetical protein